MYKPDADGNPLTLTDAEDTNLTGGTVPADVFYDFMKAALENMEVQDFPTRAGVGDDKIPTPTTTFTPAPTTTTTQAPTTTTTQAPTTTTTQAPTTTQPTKTNGTGKPQPTTTQPSITIPLPGGGGPSPTSTKPGNGP
jgi:membrane peptidoglycan carboxypeptidase